MRSIHEEKKREQGINLSFSSLLLSLFGSAWLEPFYALRISLFKSSPLCPLWGLSPCCEMKWWKPIMRSCLFDSWTYRALMDAMFQAATCQTKQEFLKPPKLHPLKSYCWSTISHSMALWRQTPKECSNKTSDRKVTLGKPPLGALHILHWFFPFSPTLLPWP